MNIDRRTLSFYPRGADGISAAFFWADIDSAGALRSFIDKIFDRHRHAVEIDVFDGDGQVGLFRRSDSRLDRGGAAGERITGPGGLEA